jgi:hypothetical protein
MLRRHLGLLALCLAGSSWLGLAQAAEPALQFLNRSEAATLMAGPGAQTYFDAMQGPELVAKTRLDLLNLPLAAAREQARAHYASEVQEFSADEQAMLHWAVGTLWPTLTEKAPLYARTPWKFAKVSDKVEGGLPHTRGDTIVFSAGLMQNLLAPYRAGDRSGLLGFLGYLLVHEQTHVLQRSQSALFDTLATQVLGFTRIAAPQTPALLARGVVNPDAPLSEWIFPLPDAPGQAVLPYLQLSNLKTPSMPRDFQMVAVMYRQEQGEWRLQEREGQPVTQPLLGVAAYVNAFPDRSGLYHPYEMAADLLSYWLGGRADASARHTVRLALQAWAAKALQ